jgi:hypothetical protein
LQTGLQVKFFALQKVAEKLNYSITQAKLAIHATTGQFTQAKLAIHLTNKIATPSTTVRNDGGRY